MFRIFVYVGLTLSVLLGTAGCNTIQGIGKDVKKAGEVVEDAAKKK
jgi:predicted small secreted protein